MFHIRALTVLVVSVLLLLNICSAKRQKYERRKERDNGCPRYPTQDEYESCVTCNFLLPKDVTLRVRNVLREPNFDVSVTINCTRSKTLFYIMQEAAEADPVFRFTVSYDHSGHPGFFVKAFNNVFSTWEDDQSWWQILDGELNLTPVGVSSYVPQDGETVTFNLTQGWNS